jgi:hypothetical protein
VTTVGIAGFASESRAGSSLFIHDRRGASTRVQLFLAYFEHHRLRSKNRALAVRVLMTAVAAIAADFAIDSKMRLDDPALADEIARLVLGYVRDDR